MEKIKTRNFGTFLHISFEVGHGVTEASKQKSSFADSLPWIPTGGTPGLGKNQELRISLSPCFSISCIQCLEPSLLSPRKLKWRAELRLESRHRDRRCSHCSAALRVMPSGHHRSVLLTWWKSKMASRAILMGCFSLETVQMCIYLSIYLLF